MKQIRTILKFLHVSGSNTLTLNNLMSAEFMDSSGPEMLQNREKCSPTENVLPIIKSSDRSITDITEHEEIETFQATNISMLCLKCSNYVNLKSLQDHRALHDALALFQYDFQAKPTNEQALSRKRAALIKDLNKLLNISRSAYRKELGKIDLAYEVIKSAICGRSNKVKPSFIEHHDVIIRSVRAKLHEGVALGVCESTNEKWKSVMEDAYSYMYESSEGRSITYFAVFDGYSGPTAAKQCAGQFYQILKETLNDCNFNECIKDIDCQLLGGFQQAFDNMDKVLLHGTNETSRNRWSGCSATTCILMDNTLHVANVGNVKAALIKDDDSFQMLTEDHTPANKKEKHRIKASGDIHKWSKTLWVNGVVMTTRGLGNHGDPLLKLSIINVPAVCCVPLADGQIILVASYSFWQVFNENEAVLLIKEWLKGNADELRAAGNSVNSDKNNCSNSIEIIIQNEDSLKTESLDTIDQLEEGETVGNSDFNASKTGNHERYTNLNENQCSQCLNINNATCNCVSNGQDLLPSNTSDMSEQDSNYDTTSSTQPVEQKTTEERSLSKLLRDLVMKYDTDIVAVEISKHLMKAALTGGAKENITVMVVIPYNVVASNNEFTSQ